MTTPRMDIRRAGVKYGWKIEVDNGHHFRAVRSHWTLSVWYTGDGRVLVADLTSPDDVILKLTAADTEKTDIVMIWLRDVH